MKKLQGIPKRGNAQILESALSNSTVGLKLQMLGKNTLQYLFWDSAHFTNNYMYNFQRLLLKLLLPHEK